MQQHFIYPIYTSVLAIITVILVPRKEIKRLAMYGIVFGAVADVFFIKFIGLIGMGEYLSFKYFGAFGIPFFPPIAWTAYFITFLYLLPRKKPWIYLFPAIASCYSVYFSNILQALGILKWSYGNPILPLILIYAPWHFGVTWAYLKIFGLETKQNKTRKYRVIPVPAMKEAQEREKASQKMVNFSIQRIRVAPSPAKKSGLFRFKKPYKLIKFSRKYSKGD